MRQREKRLIRMWDESRQVKRNRRKWHGERNNRKSLESGIRRKLFWCDEVGNQTKRSLKCRSSRGELNSWAYTKEWI